MHNAIQISKLNDFIFCPYSLYFHGVYESFHENVYHTTPQKVGKIRHQSIDTGTYSSSRRYMQGTAVYSQQHNLIGKIDVYDSTSHTLIERKYTIRTIYLGYKYQLYAQYLCLVNMGYPVRRLLLHSLSDNKRYPVDIPRAALLQDFLSFLQRVRRFRPQEEPEAYAANPQKCARCIYCQLCDKAVC